MNKKLNIQRTTGAIVFETVFLVLLVAIWGIIIWLVSRAPSVVPTHFDASGQPNAYGSPTTVLIPCVIITVVAIATLFGAYFPKATLNLPFYNKEKANPQQDRLAVLLIRILAVFMLVLLLLVALSSLVLTNHSPVPVLVVVGAMVVVSIVFTVLMYKVK